MRLPRTILGAATAALTLGAALLAPPPQSTLDEQALGGCAVHIRPADPTRAQVEWVPVEMGNQVGLKFAVDVPSGVSLVAGDVDSTVKLGLTQGSANNKIEVLYDRSTKKTSVVITNAAGTTRKQTDNRFRGTYDDIEGNSVDFKLVRPIAQNKQRLRVLVEFRGIRTAFTLMDG